MVLKFNENFILLQMLVDVEYSEGIILFPPPVLAKYQLDMKKVQSKDKKYDLKVF